MTLYYEQLNPYAIHRLVCNKFSLPPGQAMALNREVESGSYLKDNLFIDLNPENRWGHVRYGGEVINAKVINTFGCILRY